MLLIFAGCESKQSTETLDLSNHPSAAEQVEAVEEAVEERNLVAEVYEIVEKYPTSVGLAKTLVIDAYNAKIRATTWLRALNLYVDYGTRKYYFYTARAADRNCIDSVEVDSVGIGWDRLSDSAQAKLFPIFNNSLNAIVQAVPWFEEERRQQSDNASASIDSALFN